MKFETKVERKSDRELVVTRTFNAPASIVFQAWAKPELFKRWWTPKSFGIRMLSCEMDVRTGGSYRLVFAMTPEKAAECGVDPSQTFDFFGKYTEVIPNSRMVWTNDEDKPAKPSPPQPSKRKTEKRSWFFSICTPRKPRSTKRSPLAAATEKTNRSTSSIRS